MVNVHSKFFHSGVLKTKNNGIETMDRLTEELLKNLLTINLSSFDFIRGSRHVYCILLTSGDG